MTISWLDVSDTTPRISYVATSGQTTFSVPFAFHSAAHLAVYKNSVLLTYVTHYVVTGVDEEAGGSIILVTGATVSDSIVIARVLSYELTTHIPPSGPLDVPAINVQFALLVMMIQQAIAGDLTTHATTATAGYALMGNGAFDSTYQGFLQSGTGATTRSWISKGQDTVSVKDFGAVCDGTTDDTVAVQAALNTGLRVVLPPGTTKITGVLTISVSGTAFIGAGMASSTLTSSSTTASMISITAGITHVTIADMFLTRSVTAVSGSGIVFAGNTQVSVLRNLWVEKQFDGFGLSTTDYSRMEDCVANANRGDGVRIINTASSGTCQWILDNILSEQNTLRGFLVASIAGPSQMTLGEMTRLYSYANSSFGFYAAGLVGVPIQGIRMSNSFFGQDGNHEVEMDTYGGLHVFNKVFTELAGTILTGPTLATAASGVGDGFNLTANNTSIELFGCLSDGNSVKGVNSACPILGITGGQFTRNGAAGATSGISIAAASTIRIIGARSNGSPQNFGIALAAAAINGVIEGNDVSGTGGSISDSSTGTTLRIINNTGYNPVGVTAAATMGASPATVTAGHAPETHYVRQSATNTATITKGSQQVATLAGATTYYTIELAPNEAYVTTWITTAPTYTKDVH